MSKVSSVCVVDYDPEVRQAVSGLLDSMGYRALEANNATEALATIHHQQPEAVLLGLSLPDMSGFEVCRSIHGIADGLSIPVMIITADDDHEYIHHAFDCGAVDFITKPINLDVLRFRLQCMLRTHRAHRDLRQHKRQLEKVKTIAKIADWSWDVAEEKLTWSAEMYSLLGIVPQTVNTQWDLLAYVHPEDRMKLSEALDAIFDEQKDYDIEYRLKGEYSSRYIHEQAQVIKDSQGLPVSIIGTLQDVSEQKVSEEQLHYLAYHDSLTGLANRELFHNQLNLAVKNARALGQKFSVLFLDLDDFKQVNDNFGHDMGDELLINVANRLTNNLRKCDVISRNFKEKLRYDYSHNVARVGGDEFLILLMGEYKPARLQRISERIIASLHQDYIIEGERLKVSCSVGIVIYPSDASDSVNLYKRADEAMYQSKAMGKNQYCFYDSSLNTSPMQAVCVKDELRTAIQKQQLRLHYQPIIDIASRKITRLEALLRWQHPRLGLLAPEKFLKLIKSKGQFASISRWVLNRVNADIKALHPLAENLSWAVNVSVNEFNDLSLINNIRQLLKRTRLKPEGLVIEISESLLIGNQPAVMKNLQSLRALGVAIHIDDFGSGHCSLSNLSLYPSDMIKIDRNYIESIGVNPQTEKVIQAVISLGHSLDKKIVAEGVSSREQFELLSRLGCDEAQGYYLAEPMSLDELKALLSSDTLLGSA